MLMPKRTKHRKMFRGRMKGAAHKGNFVAFGDYGLQALEPSWITNRQIESCRVAINRTFKREGKTYTYDTLVELKKEREDAHFYFIMGGDSLAQFEQWYHPEKIVKLCTILAASRDEVSYEQTKEYCKQLSERLDGDFRPLKIPAMSISSHEIRKRIKKGK